MKSLADQLREQLVKPADEKKKAGKAEKSTKSLPARPAIMEAIIAHDTTGHKSMVHTRFDEKTVGTLNQFKMATGVDLNKLVSFSVKHLFDTYPELKTIIKQFIQNTEI